jgi:hypothetical protein
MASGGASGLNDSGPASEQKTLAEASLRFIMLEKGSATVARTWSSGR